MPGRAQQRTVEAVRSVGKLRGRREVQVLAFYLGGSWIIYEVTALTADTFGLSQLVVRLTVLVLASGALLAIPMSRWYELTARAVDRGGAALAEIEGVPDVLEPALARAYRRVSRRTAVVAGAGSTLAFTGFFFVLWNAWAEAHAYVAPDSRISIVVFPFRTPGPAADAFGEAIGDLLVVTLDGTPGIRIVDPASVWRSLRPKRGEPARAPEFEDALTLSRRVGAGRFVIGSALPSGSNLDLSARVYDAESGELLATLKAAAHEDSMTSAVHRLAIDLVASVWVREQLPTVPEIERFATSNADALKAYLEAKSLSRRGLFDDAQEAIERAVSLDSTFALALLEQFHIRSRVLFQNAEPFIGLRPIIEQAMRHREKLTPRNRLRVEASRAMDDTDGARAAFLLERILSIDSLDIGARHGLAFVYLRDGWQVEKTLDDIIRAYDRVLELDPNSINARALRANLAIWSDDAAAAQRELAKLRSLDSVSVTSRAIIGSYRALEAPDSEVADVLRSLASEPSPVVFTVLRNLRTTRPALAELYMAELMADSLPVPHQRIGLGARTQLWFAQGRLTAADSVLQTGALENIRSWINLYFVATALAGVGAQEISERAVAELSAYVPADSLLHYFNERPAWLIGWAVGAYHATFGDTAKARTWHQALGTLPGGGTSLDYRASLQADIEARMAARRGDLDAAEREARRAYEQWGYHSGSLDHFHPEVAMRFHLAEILRAKGADDKAESFYRSLCPPHTWYGFYTARSAFELGRMEEARGVTDEARNAYLIAARLWEAGEPEVVGAWLARTRAGLDRLGGEAGAG